MYDILELSKKLLPELREIGKELDIKRVESFKKQDLIYKILDKQAVMTTETKKTEKKILARPTNQEQPESIQETLPVNNDEKPAALPEKTDLPAPEARVERQPLIKPFPKRMERPQSDNPDIRERRPRVLKTESALVASTTKVVEEETRKKEAESEKLPFQEEKKAERIEKPEVQERPEKIDRPERNEKPERNERMDKTENEIVPSRPSFQKRNNNAQTASPQQKQ
jgi:transcription termination factor Rho